MAEKVSSIVTQWYHYGAGMGWIYSGRGFIRGGNWNNGGNAGAETLNLNNTPGNTNNNIGFRCARARIYYFLPEFSRDFITILMEACETQSNASFLLRYFAGYIVLSADERENINLCSLCVSIAPAHGRSAEPKFFMGVFRPVPQARDFYS